MHVSVGKKKKVISRTLKSVSCTGDILCKIHRAGSSVGGRSWSMFTAKLPTLYLLTNWYTLLIVYFY